MASIEYVFVSREDRILSSYSPLSGNFELIAIQLLPRLMQNSTNATTNNNNSNIQSDLNQFQNQQKQEINNIQSKFNSQTSPNQNNFQRKQLSYKLDSNHVFHFLFDHDSVIFGCLASTNFDRKLCLAMLFDLSERFWAKTTVNQVELAPAYSYNRTFTTVISSQVDYYQHNPSNERVAQISEKLSNVKDELMFGVENLLERGEKIKDLSNRVDQMANRAQKFNANATKMKQTILNKVNAKHYLFVAILIGVILWLTYQILR